MSARLGILAGIVLLAVVQPEAAAQTVGWARTLALTKSTDSRSSTRSPSCDEACQRRDVLAPVSLTALELELAHRISGESAVTLEYYLRLVPIALVRGNPSRSAIWSPGVGWQLPVTTERTSTIGIGVKPIGMRMGFGSRNARVEADLSVGVFGFEDPLLAANAARLNAVVEVGLGARVSRLVFGYRRHHLSNGGLGTVNPGLDSNVIYVGFVF
jgi:hypothetical protein